MLTPAPGSRTVVAVLAASGIVATLVQTAVVPLLPELPRLTRSAPVDVGWVVTVTLLTGAVATHPRQHCAAMRTKTGTVGVGLPATGAVDARHV